MLAGCSSSALLSPRHRLRSEAPSAAAQFQPCNYPMNTQRFDLACGSTRKEASRPHQPIRAVGISVEKKKKQIERPASAGGGCRGLKQSIRLPPLSTGAPVAPSDGFGNRLKRLAEQGGADDVSRAKRKRNGGGNDDVSSGGDEGFWFSQGFEAPPVVVPFSLTCPASEEERVCFVPSEVITNPNWFQSITNVGEPTDLHRQAAKERSGSSSSEDSHSSDFRQAEYAPPGRGEGNGSRTVVNINNPHPQPQGRNEAAESEEDRSRTEQNDLELINLLAACVEAVGSKSIAETNHYIARLGELASPRGSPMTRLVRYYTEALALRVSRVWPHVFQITPPRDCDRIDDDSGSALRFLNQASPIPKFIHFTSNEILLRAFEGKDRVHIIDFDIRQGLQWPGLLQSLASRAEPPSHVRITGVGDSKGELNETGDRLACLAEALGIPFEFHPVVDRLEDVRLWMLHVTAPETVAVNCVLQLHKTLHDGAGGALGDFLGLLRSTNPSVVLVAEQECSTNGQNFESRVVNSLKHYSALFDSIDHSLPRDSAARVKIEEMFGREIKNVIACEGSDRVERHEEFERWRVAMERGGFRNIGITDREVMQSKMLLKMYRSGDDEFSVQRQGGSEALTLSFSDQPLYTVSAWSPVDGQGS